MKIIYAVIGIFSYSIYFQEHFLIQNVLSIPLFPHVKSPYKNVDLTGMVMIVSKCITKSCTEQFQKLKYRCFGFLIHPKIVLTVSDCLPREDFVNLVRVRAYNWTFYHNEIDEWIPFRERYVAKIIHHPSYNSNLPENQFYNFSSVVLTNSLDIQPLFELANQNDTLNEQCIDIDSQGDIEKDGLHLVQFPSGIFDTNSIESHACFTNHKTKSSFGNNNIFCASNDQQISCGGSPGNPLLCQKFDNKEKYFLKGILINRKECQSAYLNTDNLHEWIKEIKTSLD